MHRQRVILDNMEKFGSFYKDHNKTLFMYLMRMTGDYYLASDIMQESFVRYLERYGKQEPRAALLFAIARNAVFDHSRRKGRHTYATGDSIEWNQSQENELMVRQEYRRVIKAMHKLKEDERDILALAISDGLCYREISSIVGISLENVKVKIHRIRMKLKKFLQTGDES